jgi:hypothetical protein
MEQLFTAIAAAQGEMKSASFNKINPHFKSRYADLAAIISASVPVLSKHGLGIVQFPTDHGGQVWLVTWLTHKSGQHIEGRYPIAPGTPQQMGSAMTYAKRYSWSAMCGIAADDDDDANAAEGPGTNRNVTDELRHDGKTLNKAQSRPVYTKLIDDLRKIDDRSVLTAWGLENSERIHAMHDEFQKFFRDEYKAQLDKATAKKPTDFKQALRDSVDELEKDGDD